MKIQIGHIKKVERDDGGIENWDTIATSVEELVEFLNDADEYGILIADERKFTNESLKDYWFRVID